MTGWTQAANAKDFITLEHYDLPGKDLRTPVTDPRLKNISLSACRQACLKERRCAAFTYDEKKDGCFLKGGMSNPMQLHGAVSGVRTLRHHQDQSTEQKTTKKAAQVQQKTDNGLKPYNPGAAKPKKRQMTPEEAIRTALGAPIKRTTKTANHTKNPAKQNDPLKVESPAKENPLPPVEPQPQIASTVAQPERIRVQINQARTPAPRQPSSQISAKQRRGDRLAMTRPDTSAWQPADANITLDQKNRQTVATITKRPLPSAPITASVKQPVGQPVERTVLIPSSAHTVLPTGYDKLTTGPTPTDPSASVKTARLTPAPQTKPIKEVSSDAVLLSKTLKKALRYTRQARRLSASYLSKYDKEQAGTKWIKLESVGMSMPMTLTRTQAKALVLGKMREDAALNTAQKRLAFIDRTTITPLKNMAKLLPVATRDKLMAAHKDQEKTTASFRKARANLSYYGGKLRKKVKQTWNLPSDVELKKLHRLARIMRRRRAANLKARKIFAEQLKQALKSSVAVAVN